MGLLDLFKKRGGEPPADSGEVQRLVAQLNDSDWKVRFAACQALGKLGSRAQSAVPALQELINDDHGDVCNAAAAALSSIERNLP